ncbi:hypothetical protein HPP92_027420 [Vanilla planifolia]|uniref:Uncharacterized protein n=1 Tax=Vanilla planifolia TaxID=51239 RepID=A0A835U5P2_VANPL|nr:hypothetical protein HPP92_027420 [Vanilla planifolia]
MAECRKGEPPQPDQLLHAWPQPPLLSTRNDSDASSPQHLEAVISSPPPESWGTQFRFTLLPHLAAGGLAWGRPR